MSQALHSDWNQPSRISGHDIAQSLSSSGFADRLIHFETLQARWKTHAQPSIVKALCMHLPIDLFQYLVMPYLVKIA
jgi:hypothetical protein